MNWVEKGLAEAEKLVPATGYNLVGVESYAPPGEGLFLAGHYESRAEAEMALKAKQGNGTTYYIYEPAKPTPAKLALPTL